MMFRFLNAEYRYICREIKKSKKKNLVYCVIEHKQENEHIYRWLEEKGYSVEYVNHSIVCISFEDATKGKALKNKHYVLKNQYIELMYLIEQRKAKKYNYVKIYSKGIYIIADIISIFKRLGYNVKENIVIINNEQWCEIEISWK